MAGPPLRANSLLTSCLLYRPPTESSEKVQGAGPNRTPCPLVPVSLPTQVPHWQHPNLSTAAVLRALELAWERGHRKKPLDVDWTLVTGSLLPTPVDPSCSLPPASGKGQFLDGTFLRGVPAGRPDKDSSASFSPARPSWRSTGPSTAQASWPRSMRVLTLGTPSRCCLRAPGVLGPSWPSP